MRSSGVLDNQYARNSASASDQFLYAPNLRKSLCRFVEPGRVSLFMAPAVYQRRLMSTIMHASVVLQEAYNSNSLSVTAPNDAEVTALAYFASTPRV
jgi:hypothetical protein